MLHLARIWGLTLLILLRIQVGFLFATPFLLPALFFLQLQLAKDFRLKAVDLSPAL
jgi:hypothetical protein